MQEYIINGLLIVADSDCYGSTVNFADPGRRRI